MKPFFQAQLVACGFVVGVVLSALTITGNVNSATSIAYLYVWSMMLAWFTIGTVSLGRKAFAA